MTQQSDANDAPITLIGDEIPRRAPKPTDPMADAPLPKAKPILDQLAVPQELRIKHWLPSTAKHIAKIAVMRFYGDIAAAVQTMKPGFSDLEYAIYASYLEKQPSIRTAIREEYEALELGEETQKRLKAVMMEVIERDPTSKAAQSYVSVLARATGLVDAAEEGKQTQELPIKGLKEGLESMLGTGKETDDAQSGAGFDSIKAMPDKEEE